MSDDFKKNNQSDIDAFFAEFDKISNDFTKNTPTDSTPPSPSDTPDDRLIQDAEEWYKTPDVPRSVRKTRSERLAEEKQKRHSHGFGSAAAKITETTGNTAGKVIDTVKAQFFTEENASESTHAGAGTAMKNSKTRSKKKYSLNKKKFAKFVLAIGGALCLLVGFYTVFVIATAPEINPDTIYSLLSESSIIYDDDGEMVDTVGGTETRTNVEYGDIPQDLVDAVVSIEDKTFETHNGFNVIRIFGAIKDSIVTGGQIGGTSTVTQQLAGNVYLDRSERSLKRKIAEAYYTVLIERALTKDQIMEAYLNTIYLGFNSYGVQMASQAYFSKDVDELDLTECVALASLPKAPHAWALVKKLEPQDVDPDTDTILYTGSDYTYVYNGDKSEDRRIRTLENMYEFGYISEQEKNDALNEDLLDHININTSAVTQMSSYFTDYTVSQVIDDLMKYNKMDEQEAKDQVYGGGLKIYSTMDAKAQKIVDAEFAKNTNFPTVAKISKDKSGNVLGKNGSVLLYDYNNYFDSDNNFVLKDNEYKQMSNGDLKLYKGHRLNFYNVKAASGGTTTQLSFNKMYIQENGVFYSIAGGTGGGAILLPEGYTSKDSDGNAVIDADFFDDNEFETGPQQFFKKASGGGLYVDSAHYSLEQKVVQPQSAMVITDYKNGHIKAMAGGRNTIGERLFNRATSQRQPGSSIKPITVYGAALQQSAELLKGGSSPSFSSGNMYGEFFTAASVIEDAPLVINGKVWPKNWYSGYKGFQTLRQSVQQSINVNAVKVFMEVGPSYAVKYAEKLGITGIVKSGSSNDMNAAALALGGMTDGISPLEMAGAYGTYPNGGTYVEPIIYTKVTNQRGDTILEKTASSYDAVDPGVAFIMTDILRTTVTNGIAGKAAIGNQPVAGKTGTTTDNYDAWFVGVTPQYTAALWIGNDVNLELSTGSAAAAGLWSKIMKQVTSGMSGSFPSKPANVVTVTIDTRTGMLPAESTPVDNTRSEYFIDGTQPKSVSNVRYATICDESGYLATPDCPMTTTHFSNKLGAGVSLPTYYCPIHNPDKSQYPVAPEYGGGSDNGNGSSDDENGVPGNNGNGNGNGNGSDDDGTPPGDGSQKPGWM